MEVKMNNPEALKQQFTDKQPEPNSEELKKQLEELKERMVIQEKMLDERIPFMRKQAEYDRLQMEMTELDVLMGRLSPLSVPGLLGLELTVRETNARGYMAQFTASQTKIENDRKDMDEMAEAEKKARAEWEALSPEEQDARQQAAIAEYNKFVEAQKAAEKAQA